AWALVAYGRIAGDAEAVAAGLANADWALAQQRDNGYFAENGFKPGGNANTHGTAYVMRGLFQIHQLTGRRDVLAAVEKAADQVAAIVEREGWIAAELGPDWEFRSGHICLTGCAQLAIIFLRLAAVTGNERYVPLAERLIAQVAATQTVRGEKRHSGAIAGSYPIQGAYAPFQYPNWATKFFADALLERERWHAGQRSLPEDELFAG
ncbi:MAG: hypothetical protein KDE18_08475, partial [Rhodobacteraceae bacterium]|nr:hypothetical protein [Paracoccaceae bacterium]